MEDRLSQSLYSSQPDSQDNSLDTLVIWHTNWNGTCPINESITNPAHNKALNRDPSYLFTGTTADNVLDWLKNFDHIAAHNVWNDQKQLQVVPVYLKDAALNFYHSLPDQTKTDITLRRLLYEIAITRRTDFMTCV